MLKLTKTNTLSAVALAIAVIATPSLAAANTFQNTAYENCKRSDTNNQILGGVIGAVAGGVLGHEVAGRNARTEGSAIGAIIGAVAGTQIADKDCRKDTVLRNDGFRNTATVYTPPRVATVGYRTVKTGTHNGFRNNGRLSKLAKIDREIYETRAELDALRKKSRYTHSRKLDRRIDQLGYKLRELKNKLKYLS